MAAKKGILVCNSLGNSGWDELVIILVLHQTGDSVMVSVAVWMKGG